MLTTAQDGTGQGNGRAVVLSNCDLADLKRSGLSDEQIQRCGFRTLFSPAQIADVLRWGHTEVRSLGNCLYLPFFDAKGEPTGYGRLKPSKPRNDRATGKPVRYESPKGSSNRAYFPPFTRENLTEKSASVILTEGEKKAAAADQHGFACIGVTGVYSWMRRREKDQDGRAIGKRYLIDDLEAIDWKGRKVVIVFDSDAATNKNVRFAEWHLSQVLAEHGADVKAVRLSPGEPDSKGNAAKVGLDDYLLAHGPEALRELIDAAEPAAPPEYERPLEEVDDPFPIARGYIEEHGSNRDGLLLRRYAAEFHRYDGTAYRVIPEDEIRARLTAYMKEYLDRIYLRLRNQCEKQNVAQGKDTKKETPPAVPKITRNKIGDVLQSVGSMTTLPLSPITPFWIGDEEPFPSREILACQNGLIHLPSFVAGKGDYQIRSTPRFFSANVLPFHFDRTAPPPAQWREFLYKTWSGDPEAINTLQEWFGYCLLPVTYLQKILLIVGPKRSGKGTIARVLRELIGVDNTAGPTLASLATNFGLSGLLNKTLAVISDARLSGRTDVAVITERLLSISGEDGVDVDRKFLPPLTAVRLLVRFLILTNELPRLNDPSGALVSRLIILRQTESWLGKEDPRLTGKLLLELPSILLWAIEGYQRLQERGYFVQPKSGVKIVQQLEELSSPIGAFLRERCKVGPECDEFARELFAEWQRWCETVGKKDTGTEQTFGRDLRAALPHLDTVQPRVGNERPRKYIGVRVRVAGLDDQDGDGEG
jgi:putative DNA primase/helicase